VKSQRLLKPSPVWVDLCDFTNELRS